MPFIRFENITKRFPGVLALDRVSFEIERGSCHALIGENGAGKSTLGKILAGIYTADAGEIRLHGKVIHPETPLAARKLGIAMVHQELAFCPNLSIAENLCLGDFPRRAGWVNRNRMREQAAAMLREIGADFDVDQPIENLSTAQEQLVQIAAALGRPDSTAGPFNDPTLQRSQASTVQVIVMDEPTSSLSVRESERLFELIERLKQRGITLIYVSHRMEEIFQLCDNVTVLRDGRHVATGKISQTDPDRVIHQMVGREVVFEKPRHLEREIGPERLRVENLNSPGRFTNVNFTLRAGEVLGLAGLVGAGRSEVAQAIFGLDPNVTGRIQVHGQRRPNGSRCEAEGETSPKNSPITPPNRSSRRESALTLPKGQRVSELTFAATGERGDEGHGRELPLGSVDAALNAGIGLVPEDRKRLGLVLTMNCRENSSLAALPRLTRLGFVQRRKEESLVQRYVDQLRVKTPSLEAPVAGLSGGNQQKIALAKWLARECDVLIVDEPTRGVDVGAKAQIHHLLDELACQGLALLVISSELPELMNLSRRILVMRDGEMTGELARPDFNQPALMRLMAGVK